MSVLAQTTKLLLLPLLLPLLLLILLPSTEGQRDARPPHMVVIIADDLGWSDVGFRDPEMHTPTIDRLMREGVLLNSSYMMKSCTPSRSSMMTGRYAFRMGLQDESLTAAGNNSVPVDLRFFAQDLQQQGYSTHYVGKWHLGFCRPSMTPTQRGFHTFYGMYNGMGDYFSHTTKGGYDMQDDAGARYSADWSARDRYSTELFTEKAVQLIEAHDVSRPLFLLLSYQAVHGPLQVPPRYVTKHCSDVTAGGEKRQLHCAMTAAMDEGIGQVMRALRARGMEDNLITFFTSDNGGPVKYGSSNWPLRGSKITEWEGGTRVVSIVHSKTHLPRAPYVWDGLIHAVDWHPTLLQAAGMPVQQVQDGVAMWDRIASNRSSRRDEFVYNLNDAKENYSLRWKQYKLVSLKKPQPNGWFNPPAGQGEEIIPPKGALPEFMLFDIEQDPEEKHDLIGDHDHAGRREHHSVLNLMKMKLTQYKAHIVPSQKAEKLATANPDLHGGAWTTGWC